VVPTDRTRENKHKKFHLNTRKLFFTVRMVRHWNRLSRQVVEPPALEIFKTWLKNLLDC